jgi:hypothetical protein
MTEQITIEKNALGTVWVSRGGARVFGLPLSTSVDRVGEVAEREGERTVGGVGVVHD